MVKHLKKIILAAIMLLAANGVWAYHIFIGGIFYNVTNDTVAPFTLEVTHGSHNYSGSIVIPDSIVDQGFTYFVSGIGDHAFSNCTGLTHISMPNSIKSIGFCAFQGCSNLDSIILSDSLEIINIQAFHQCSGLTSISIPNSVTKIYNNAFYGCTGLTSLYIGNSVTYIGTGAFFNCSRLSSITIPRTVTYIGSNAFGACSNLTTINFNADSCRTSGAFVTSALQNINIGNNVRIIDSGSFSNCQRLVSLAIPNNVICVGDYALSRCISLTSVTIPNSIKKIGKGAFMGCSSLQSITMPDSVKIIGEGAFNHCTNLNSINVSSGNTHFKSRDGVLFNYNQDTLLCCPGGKAGYYCIPNTVTSVGKSAFLGCTHINSITIPTSVTSIGEFAFYQCDSLLNAHIHDSVTYIGEWAFSYDTNLRYVNISNSITSIKGKTFIGCKRMNYVIIPQSVTDIGESAFAGCSGLTSLTIRGSGTRIDCYAFDGCTQLEYLTFKGYNPPSLHRDSFIGVPSSVNIFVPCNRIVAYLRAIDNILPPYLIEVNNEFSLGTDNIDMGNVQLINTPSCTNPQAIIRANPNTGYYFSRWSDGNTQNPRSLTVTQDTVLIAYFTSNQGIAEADNDNISIRSSNGHILLKGISNERVHVSDVLGRVVYNATVNEKIDIAVRNRGVYFVKVGNRPARKVVVVN